MKISNKQFVNAYRSAGLWFVVIYMEPAILRIEELRNLESKNKFIEEMYDNNIGATRTRVNCLLKIIKSGRIKEVLQIATNSTRLNNKYPEAIIKAGILLEKIKNNEIDISIFN